MSYNILIVEDQKIIAVDISLSLQQMGYKVVGMAISGEEAIAKVSKLVPDLVLMDIKLKGAMDGVEAAKIITEQLSVPIIFLTSHSDEVTVRRAKKILPYGYIIKPYQPQELQTMIELALYRHTQLKKALKKEQEISQSRSNLIFNLSSEFRTPLNAILQSVEQIANYGAELSDEEKVKLFATAFDGVRNIEHTLEDNLFLERTEINRFKLQYTNLNLVTFCQSLIREYATASTNQNTVIFRKKNLKAAYLLDEKLLRQILGNLLSNALKNSPSETPVILELLDDKDNLVIRVIDKGAGIPLADQKDLFSFFRHSNKSSSVSNRGLGLAIVKKAVDVYDGELSFTTVPNEGTTFTVILPY